MADFLKTKFWMIGLVKSFPTRALPQQVPKVAAIKEKNVAILDHCHVTAAIGEPSMIG